MMEVRFDKVESRDPGLVDDEYRVFVGGDEAPFHIQAHPEGKYFIAWAECGEGEEYSQEELAKPRATLTEAKRDVVVGVIVWLEQEGRLDEIGPPPWHGLESTEVH